MNNILLKVQQYLDSASRKPVKLDEQLLQNFGEACKNALLKQFQSERRSKFEPRMSNVGRPLCQLQMEAKGIKGEGQPYNVKMRNTFGDIIEALAIFIMKSADVDIPVVVGGIIRRQEVELLKGYGVSEVFFPGTGKKEIVERIRSLGKKRVGKI